MNIRHTASAFALLSLAVALAACGERPAGTAASDAASTAKAPREYTDREAQVNFAWVVVDKDPKGLNCRGSIFGDGQDIGAQRVVTTFAPGSMVFGTPRITRDDKGRAWLYVGYDASGCYVRATDALIAPAPLPMEYPTNFRSALGQNAAAGLQWLVISTDGELNCRATASGTAKVVHVFKDDSSLIDAEAIRSWNPTMAPSTGADLADWNVVLEVEVNAGKSWFKVWRASAGALGEAKATCYVRAHRDYIRPSR